MTDDLQEYWRDGRAPPLVRTYRGYRHPNNGPLRITVSVERISKLPQDEWSLSTQILDILNRLEGPGKGGDRGG